MIKWSNNFINGSTQGKLPCCQVWWPHALWYWRYNSFSLPHDATRPCDQRVMLLFGLESSKVSYDPVNFGGNRHSGSGDITGFSLSCDFPTLRDQDGDSPCGKSPPCQVW